MLMISHLCRFVYYGNKWPILWEQTAFSGVSAWRNLSQTALWYNNQCVYWTLNIFYRVGNNAACITKIRFCRQGLLTPYFILEIPLEILDCSFYLQVSIWGCWFKIINKSVFFPESLAVILFCWFSTEFDNITLISCIRLNIYYLFHNVSAYADWMLNKEIHFICCGGGGFGWVFNNVASFAFHQLNIP